MKAKRDIHVFALREFEYDGETGVLDRGQVIELQGHRNDEKLVNLRFLAPCTPGQELVQCGTCGKWFVDENARQNHGDRVHAYDCECGWSPGRDVVDKARSLKAHRVRCDVVKAQKELARKKQLDG